jgi:DNA mismatch repair protein MutS2
MNISREALEWEDARALVVRFASTAAGSRVLEQLEPATDHTLIAGALAEAAEGIDYLRAASSPQIPGRGAIRISLGGLPDVADSLLKLRIEGAALEGREIADILVFLERALDARSNLNAAADRFPLLGARGAAIADFRLLLAALSGKVLPDGSVADNASPHLNRLRKEIERQKKAVQDSLEQFLKANRNEGVLQEEYVTVRNDRYVVPVLSGQRRKVPGVIHGASSTGQTLFLEPLETIDLNNELVRLEEDAAREALRVLRELTQRLHEAGPEISAAADAITSLDVIFAKARFAIDFDCCIPTVPAEGQRRLALTGARHPLLVDVLRRTSRRVVPFTLTLGESGRTLLISGPNTGGKTVTLKTVGLIALMAQAGLPVPCTAAELPLFEQVLADIGDHQSIEQSLSTFSAHVARLREMALDVTPDSLVLLDEIGSATDPEEGGALGVALVDHFRAAGSFTLASTHLTALKVYGANTPTVVNASMGFDEQTLDPTYELRVGLPGKSAGLDIAARLGMPEDILKRARASLTTHEIELAKLIAGLHERLAELNIAKESLAKDREALEQRGRQMASDSEKREAARLRQIEDRFAAMEQKWQARTEETLARLQEQAGRRKADDLARRDIARVTREMREDWAEVAAPHSDTAPAPKRLKIEEGVRLRLKGIREPARVRRVLGPDKFEVEAGFLKMQVGIEDVEEVLPASTATPTGRLPKGVRYQPGPELTPRVSELNVIGERAEEAIEKVERFLDAAVMATASRVRIVHGHGMGILKRAIHELLKGNPHVARYYEAQQFEGGSGATIVEIRE